MNELKQLNVATKNYNGQFEIVDEKARLAVLELNDEVTKLVTDTTELNENIIKYPFYTCDFNHKAIPSFKVNNCPTNIKQLYVKSFYRRKYDSNNDDINSTRQILIYDENNHIVFGESWINEQGNLYPETLQKITLPAFGGDIYKDYKNLTCELWIDWTKAPKYGVNENGEMITYNNTIILQECLDYGENVIISRWKGKNVLVLGDSISSDSYLGYKSWCTQLSEEMGFGVVDASTHATGFICGIGTVTPDEKSLFNLIDTLHDTVLPNKDSIDLIIFFRGTNDFSYNVPLGNSGDEKGTSFTGAVEYCFAKCLEYWSDARIVVFTPLQRLDQIYGNSLSLKLKDYSDVIKEKAEYMSYPVLDLYAKAGCYMAKKAFNYYITTDNIHTGNTQFDLDNLMEWEGEPDGVHPNEHFTTNKLVPLIKNFLEYQI